MSRLEEKLALQVLSPCRTFAVGLSLESSLAFERSLALEPILPLKRSLVAVAGFGFVGRALGCGLAFAGRPRCQRRAAIRRGFSRLRARALLLVFLRALAGCVFPWRMLPGRMDPWPIFAWPVFTGPSFPGSPLPQVLLRPLATGRRPSGTSRRSSRCPARPTRLVQNWATRLLFSGGDESRPTLRSVRH